MVETTDAHRDTATISTETEEIASAEGPALALVLVLAARRDEEADTTTITTAREAQTAAAPNASDVINSAVRLIRSPVR